MIAYLSWGIFSFISTNAVAYVILNEARQTLVFYVCNVWIIGVDFGDINPDTLFDDNKAFGLAVIFVFPSLAALLPAIIIGFIANFVLEEQFLLECAESITDETLCFENKYGCCEVISSHDIQNSYQFIGGLASNILFTWGIVRIVGYLMVNITPEAAIFAKRNNPL